MNRVLISLNQTISQSGKNSDLEYTEQVDSKVIKLWPWTTQAGLARRLNKVQGKMLERFSKRYKMWDIIEYKILPGFKGGNIVLNDIKTYEFIEEQIRKSKKTNLKVIR